MKKTAFSRSIQHFKVQDSIVSSVMIKVTLVGSPRSFKKFGGASQVLLPMNKSNNWKSIWIAHAGANHLVFELTKKYEKCKQKGKGKKRDK